MMNKPHPQTPTMGVGSEKVRCDMSIDIDEMVRMAGERAGWVYSDGMIYEPYIGSKEEERNHTIAVIKHVSEGEFIARAPKTIAYLAARVRVLEAQNAALQARVGLHKQLYDAVKMVIHRFQRTGLFIHIYHAMDEIEYAEAQALPDEPPTAAV